MSVKLTSDRMEVVLEPEFGARITALTDRATGRQWLVDGPCRGSASDDASYRGDEARGWDECFPTVGACQHPDWDHLRDHGLLWGWPWALGVDADGLACSAHFETERFRFERVIRLDGPTLTASYVVTNLSDRQLPYIWSQHALLATGPGERIALNGVGKMIAGAQSFDWPFFGARDLSIIHGADAAFAHKSYAETPLGASARITGPSGGIEFRWSDDIPAFGLWLDFGGWPAEAPVHQVALEPTTAPADDLLSAETIGKARTLAPGQTHRWNVLVQLTVPDEQEMTR